MHLFAFCFILVLHRFELISVNIMEIKTDFDLIGLLVKKTNEG